MNDPMLLGYAVATDPDQEVLWTTPEEYVASGIHYAATDGANPDLFQQWCRDTKTWLDTLGKGEDPTKYENTLGIVAVYAKEETNANDDQH